jgi:hypothetical protein
MKILTLGWGSLVWDPRDLKISDGWHLGGPKLPVEFSRVSRDNRLTLVIDETNGEDVYTRYALSLCDDLAKAQQNLKEREGTGTGDIAFANLTGGACSCRGGQHSTICDRVKAWAAAMVVDAVVWTALVSNFQAKKSVPFSVENAIGHLQGLTGFARIAALEYLARAPAEVITPVRLRAMGLGLISSIP